MIPHVASGGADLPGPELLARIERLAGAPVQACQRVQGGYTPATRLLCRTTRGNMFVKAGATPLTSAFIQREIEVYRRLPKAPFLPQVLAWEKHETTPILILEDLSGHHWPPPWDQERVELTLAQIHAMHRTPAALEPFHEVHDDWRPGWHAVAQDPRPFLALGIADDGWLEQALPLLMASEERCPRAGGSLCHWDLRSDNICLAGQRVLFVDWNLACLANPLLDLGFWLPSLAWEGGPEPNEIMPDAPEVAAWVSGFFAARAGLSEIIDAPRVRLVQRQQLATALPWAVEALQLPPLPAGWETRLP